MNTETKKPAATRVYPVTDDKGVERLVDATSLAAAVGHVYKPKVGKPLSGAQVAAAVRDGRTIEQVAS